MSKGVLDSRPQKKTCQSSYFPALGSFGDYLYIKLKMNGISTDFQKSKISSQQNKLVCFTSGWAGGREPGRKGAGGGRREGGKRKSQGGGNREKLRKFRNILLYFAIEMGQKGGNHYEKGRKRE